MTLPDEVIDAMVAAGCTPEQLAAAVKASNAQAEEKAAKKRADAAERKRQQRHRHAMSRGQVVTPQDSCDALPSSGSSSPTPPLTPNQPSPPSPPKGGSSPAGFAEFWAIYPNKVGKSDAIRAFERAVKRTPLETIMAGLHRYVAKTDDRPWQNPATFLNGSRWEDQPAEVAPRSRASPSSARPAKAPGLADLMSMVRDKAADDEQQREEGGSTRTAIPHLSVVSGRGG